MNNNEYFEIEDEIRNRGTDAFFDDSLMHIKDPKFVKLLKELHDVYTKMDKYLDQTGKRVNGDNHAKEKDI